MQSESGAKGYFLEFIGFGEKVYCYRRIWAVVCRI